MANYRWRSGERSATWEDMEKVLCVFCSEPIGVYEPMIAVNGDGARETSLARQPELADDASVLRMHYGCAITRSMAPAAGDIVS